MTRQGPVHKREAVMLDNVSFVVSVIHLDLALNVVLQGNCLWRITSTIECTSEDNEPLAEFLLNQCTAVTDEFVQWTWTSSYRVFIYIKY